MRTSLSLSVALTFSCLVSAQSTTPEGLEIMPGRATVPASAGITYVIRVGGTPLPVFEALQMYDAKYWQGIGDLTNTGRGKNSTSPCEIDTFNVRFQDQDAKSSEAFKIVCRAEASAGSRTANTAATIWTQNVPGFPAATTGNAAGILMTVQIMTAPPNPTASAIPIPCRATFFFGMEIPAVPSGKTWGPPGPNSDGLSIIASTYDTVSPYTVFDWPKGGNSAAYLYDLVLPTGRTRFTTKMSFGYNLVPDSPILQAGARHKNGTSRHNSDNGWGAAGVWPEIDPTTTRGQLSTDGLVIRFTDNNAGSGVWGLYLSLTSASAQQLPVFRLNGLGGGVYMGIPSFYVTSGVISSVDTEVILATDGKLPVSLMGATVYLQGFTVLNNSAHITNLVGIEYKQ